jgi:CubicO group peptidase (beta-lactamase class C family)
MASADASRPLRAFLQRLVDSHTVPGLSLSVYQRSGDRQVFLHEAGVSDVQNNTLFKEDTVIDIASVSKSLIVVLAQQLVEKGRMQWNDDVAQYIPAFAASRLTVYAGAGPDGKVTTKPCRATMKLEHLATHTSGLCTPFLFSDPAMAPLHIHATHNLPKLPRGADLAAFCEMVAHCPLANQPGEGFYYGDGVDVLGRVCEAPCPATPPRLGTADR